MKVALLPVVALALAAGCSRQEETSPHARQARAPVVDPAPGQLDLYVSDGYAGAIGELVELFHQKRPNVTFHQHTDDPRTLVAQIQEGAKADVFMSAGDIEVKPLEEADLVGLRKDFCFITLGIITPKGNPAAVRSLEDLAADSTKAVAIGPADTSIGHYAVELLKEQGLWEKMEGKVASAERPLEVLALAAQGEADACLAYGARLRGQANPDRTEVRAKLELVGDLTAQYCLKIPCPAISPVGCRRPELAEEFINFLTSDGAQEALARHGFLRLEDPCCSD